MHTRKFKIAVFISFFTLLLICATYLPFITKDGPALHYALAADSQGTQIDQYTTRVTDNGGKTIDRVTVPASPPDVRRLSAMAAEPSGDSPVLLTQVPAFTWCYGCSATSASMLAGYYDQPARGYANIYPGPANGGVCPLNNETAWGHTSYANVCSSGAVTCGECPLSASHANIDGRGANRGHVDDYWSAYGCTTDPYTTNLHSNDCLADYMGTNQNSFHCTDGGTYFFYDPTHAPLYDYSGSEPNYRDGTHGMKLFMQYRGYPVTSAYNQYISGYGGIGTGFTYGQYRNEINAGRPVLIHVQGHTMLGMGYADPNIVYIHNTWDNTYHTMTWGGSYDGRQHYGVSVIQLTPQSIAINNGSGASNITGVSATLNGNLTSDGGRPTSVTIYWGTSDGGATGAWGHNASLGVKSVGAFSTDISGLTPGTIYYYRCFAINDYVSSWAQQTSSFVAGDETKIFGADDTSGSIAPAGRAYWTRWTAGSEGCITQLRIKCTTGGHVKLALYAANSSGDPGYLLRAVNTGTAVSAGWNVIPITITPVASGPYYWLAVVSDVPCIASYSPTPGTHVNLYTTVTYSTYSFTSSPLCEISDPSCSGVIAAWGTHPTPVPPSVTNGSGAVDVAATVATLTGNLTSDGNAATSVSIYWGSSDGGTDAGNWQNSINLGLKLTGTFSSSLSGLMTGSIYYYRCFASNSAGSAWAPNSASFIPPPLLLGTISTDGTVRASANSFYLSRFQALQTDAIVTYRLSASGPGNVKVAIYADNAGVPSAKLCSVDSETPVVAGQNDIAISYTVTAGTYYWVAFNSSANIVCISVATCKTYNLASNQFSGFTFPKYCTSSLPVASRSLMPDIACLGAIPVPPQTAPALISPASAVTFKWATVTGATSYWLQVNTSDNFTGTDIINSELGNIQSKDVSGFTDNSAYYWRVRAGNTHGWGNWSNIRGVTLGTPISTGLTYKNSTGAGTNILPAAGDNVTQPLLLGTSIADGTTNASANSFYLSRFQALQTDTIVTYRLNASGPGYVKIAIYEDSAGVPRIKLYSIDNQTPVVAGPNDITFSYPVTAGVYYWVAFNSSANIVRMSSIACKTYALTSNQFSGFTFPKYCTASLPVASRSLMPDIACLGSSPVPPQTAPALLSPGPSTTFKWATVSGATSYWLQVNTSDNFTGTDIINSELGNIQSKDVSGFTDNSAYYWRVKAGNINGWAKWSDIRRFSTLIK